MFQSILILFANLIQQRFGSSALNKDDGLEEIPNISGNREDFEILGWAEKAGNAVAFDCRTIHGPAGYHKPNLQRRAFTPLLVGDGANFVRREGLITSPPFDNITLQNGDPLESDDFPYLLGTSSNHMYYMSGKNFAL